MTERLDEWLDAQFAEADDLEADLRASLESAEPGIMPTYWLRMMLDSFAESNARAKRIFGRTPDEETP